MTVARPDGRRGRRGGHLGGPRLTAEFGLSPDDAALARDRVFGGLVRVGTRIPENAPSPAKDPVAWESYQRGTRDLALVTRIYPQMFPNG